MFVVTHDIRDDGTVEVGLFNANLIRSFYIDKRSDKFTIIGVSGKDFRELTINSYDTYVEAERELLNLADRLK